MDRREMSELLVRREEVRLVPYIYLFKKSAMRGPGSWSFSALNMSELMEPR